MGADGPGVNVIADPIYDLMSLVGYERKFRPPPHHVRLSPNFGRSRVGRGSPKLTRHGHSIHSGAFLFWSSFGTQMARTDIEN